MATSITYTVNYAGDFTTLSSAFSGIGTDLTYTQTGAVTQAGSTSSTIVLASTSSSLCVGHTVTCGGETQLIGSYNAGTKVATLTAKAGFSGTWTSTPGTGAAYTVADVAVTLTIGQSSSVSNVWTPGSALSLSSITTDATHGISLTSATARAQSRVLGPNDSGSTILPVCIKPSGGWTISVNFVSMVGLQYYNQGNSPFTVNATSFLANKCFFTVSSTGSSDYGVTGSHVTGTYNNCVFLGFNNANARPVFAQGSVAYNGCTFFTTGDIPVLADTATATDCAFFGHTGANVYAGAGNSGVFGMSTIRCAASNAIGSPGNAMSIVTPAFLSASAPYDFRPGAGSGLIGGSGARASTTDIFGNTRSVSASSFGAVETIFTPPAVQAVTYNVVATGGDLPTPSPNGVVSTATWSGGVATITTTAAHGMTVGNTALVALVDDTYGNATWPATYTATVTGSTTFTVPIASNPGTAPGLLWVHFVFMTVVGGASADLTYYSIGNTCKGTGSTTTIVLDTSETAACIGHPIQWQSNAMCMVTAFNTSTKTATISAIAGYSSTLGGTSISGDAYTIYPISATFAIGLAAGGSTAWVFNSCVGDKGVIQIGPAVTSSTCSITVSAAAAATYNPNAALGTITTSGSAISLRNGNDSEGVITNHSGLIGVGCGNVLFQNLQFQCSNMNQEDGCIVGIANVSAPVTFDRCVFLGTNGTDDGQHSTIFGQSTFVMSNVKMTNCVAISTNFLAGFSSQQAGIDATHCTFVNTSNVIATTSGTTASGANTIVLTSAAGIQPKTGGGVAGMFVGCAGVPITANVLSISGNTVTLNNSAVTTASIPDGTTIFFGVEAFSGDARFHTFKNCAFFGYTAQIGTTGQTGTLVNCAADFNRLSQSGLTTMSYPAQFVAASGLTATLAQHVIGGPGVTFDLRPKAGNSLQIGVYDATVSTDIFGNARANPPTVGAVEYIALLAKHAWRMILGL